MAGVGEANGCRQLVKLNRFVPRLYARTTAIASDPPNRSTADDLAGLDPDNLNETKVSDGRM